MFLFTPRLIFTKAAAVSKINLGWTPYQVGLLHSLLKVGRILLFCEVSGTQSKFCIIFESRPVGYVGECRYLLLHLKFVAS
nr:hypothetical transcript [Hymenolepis microstoma]